MELTYRQLSKKFIEFLKKHNVLDKYKENLLKQKKYCFVNLVNYINPLTLSFIKKDITQNDYAYIIDDAFTWCDTEQGHNFWSQINSAWERECRNIELVNEKISATNE